MFILLGRPSESHLILESVQLIADFVGVVQAFVDDLRDIFDDHVIPFIECLIQFFNFFHDMFDSPCQLFHRVVELRLSFFGPNTEMNVGLHIVDSVTIFHLYLILHLIWHSGVLIQGSWFLSAAHLLVLRVLSAAARHAFLSTLVNFSHFGSVRAASCLQHHIIDILYQFVLLRVKHVLVSLVELVPEVGVAGVMSSKNENEIVFLEFCVLVGVGHYIFEHLLDILFRITDVLDLRIGGQDWVLNIRQIDILLSVQPKRNHMPPSGQIVK